MLLGAPPRQARSSSIAIGGTSMFESTFPAPSVLRGVVLATVLAVASLLGSMARATEPAPIKVTYPNLNGGGKEQLGYQVLELALRSSGVPFELQLLNRPVSVLAAQEFLKSGRISIWDSGTSRELEEAYLPIYFPIDRGLNGWRLLVVKGSRAEEFTHIQNLDDLRRKSAGQGSGSADIEILEHSGIRVVTGSTWPLLFPMLENGRFDMLPLGVNEVYGFLDRYQASAPSAVVDTNVLLVYPFARLFFVRRGDVRLHDIVERGLAKAFEDGSFQALFDSQPAQVKALALARLADRRVIRIDNPLMTQSFSAIPKKYFFELKR
jgi:hypothetical protein